jgi:hypothetical protein
LERDFWAFEFPAFSILFFSILIFNPFSIRILHFLRISQHDCDAWSWRGILVSGDWGLWSLGILGMGIGDFGYWGFWALGITVIGDYDHWGFIPNENAILRIRSRDRNER